MRLRRPYMLVMLVAIVGFFSLGVLHADTITFAHIKTIETGSCDNYSLLTSGNYLYSFSDNCEQMLNVYDISNPANPTFVASSTVPHGGDSMVISGTYLYTANRGANNIKVFNISNPSDLVLVATIDTGAVIGTRPQYIYVSGNQLYVTDADAGIIQIYDISDPTNPAFLGSLSFDVNPSFVVAGDGEHLYVATYDYAGTHVPGFFGVIDISDPTAPELIATTTLQAQFAQRISLSGHYVYIAGFYGNVLQIFDVSNPANPTVVGTTPTGDGSHSTYLQDGVVYVVNSFSNTLQMYEVSDPTAPALLGSIAVPDTPTDVVKFGNYLYTNSDSGNTIEVFHIPNPAVVVARAPSDVGSTHATLNGVVNVAGDNPTERGFVWGVGGYDATTTESGSFSVGDFSLAASAFTCETEYQFAAYAINSDGVSYSSAQSFTTGTCLPSVSITESASPTASTATAHGSIDSIGGSEITQRGFVYGITDAYSATTTESGSFSVGTFSGELTGLACGTLYHYSAYAVNSYAIRYSGDNTFRTNTCATNDTARPSSGGGGVSGLIGTVGAFTGLGSGYVAPRPQLRYADGHIEYLDTPSPALPPVNDHPVVSGSQSSTAVPAAPRNRWDASNSTKTLQVLLQGLGVTSTGKVSAPHQKNNQSWDANTDIQVLKSVLGNQRPQ